MEPALKTLYTERVVPALKEKFGYANPMQVPKIEKVVINTSFGRAEDRKAASEEVVREMGLISGQRPVLTRSKKAISNFKLRIGDTIGAKVTIRGRRM